MWPCGTCRMLPRVWAVAGRVVGVKWLLWSQLALVVVSLGVAVGAMTTNRYGVVLLLSMGIMPLLLVAGAVMGLIAVRRRQSFVAAGIGLLAPALWVVVTSIPDDHTGRAASGELREAAYLPLNQYEGVRRELESALAWLDWFWWLNLAAAAVGLVSGVLLLRRARVG